MTNIVLCSNSVCKKHSYCLRHLAVKPESKKFKDFRFSGCKEPSYLDYMYPGKDKTLSLVAVESIWKEKRAAEFKREVK